MQQEKTMAGHIAAIVTVIIWGTTFISTKILLTLFSPIEILVIRFLLGYLMLGIIFPHPLKLQERRQELLFAAAGLAGVCLYYLMENMALVYASASGVGVIVASAPLFTGIFSAIFLKEDRLRPQFFLGFASAMIGIAMISFGGQKVEGFHIIGNLLALASAVAWGFYSILTRKIAELGYPTIGVTRRTFFWGILFMIPGACAMGFHPTLDALLQPKGLLNLIYLGVFASAAGFVMWNFAVERLGAVRACAYIYATPAITVVTAWMILNEKLTFYSGFGTVLVIMGLLLSESKEKKGGADGGITQETGKT